MAVEGTGGTLSYQGRDGAWHEIGPVSEVMTAVSATIQCFEALGSVAVTASGVITKLHWNRMCKMLGLPYYYNPSTPLRPRKHGGRLPSYRDVRQKWHTT